MAIISKHYARMNETTGMVEVSYAGERDLAGAPEDLAVLFSDSPEWQPSGFEGPPALSRSFFIVRRAYEGRVLGFSTRCERIMSDVYDDVTYAKVLGPASTPMEVALGAAIDRTGDREIAELLGLATEADASEATKARYEEAVRLDQEFAVIRERVRRARDAKAKAAAEAREPKKGRKVRVVKGRKVAIGTEGTVTWYGEGRAYGFGSRAPMRVGIKLASGEVVWTDASNVQVIGAPALPSAKECEARRASYDAVREVLAQSRHVIAA